MMNSARWLVVLTLVGLAADAHASEFLGRDRRVQMGGSAGLFDQVTFQLNLVESPFGATFDVGSAVLTPADVGRSVVMTPGPEFAEGVALLTNGVDNFIETLVQSPSGAGGGFASQESVGIEFEPFPCWSGVDFQGATIERIEFFVIELTLTPGAGAFTNYDVRVGVDFYGTPPGAPAGEVVRLGTPPNPQALLAGVTSGPVLGQTWDPVIDHGAFVPNAVADFLAIDTTATDIASPIGTLLCGASPALIVPATPGEPFAVPMPVNCSFVGFTLCAQGAGLDPFGGVQLTNALDATIGSY